MNLPLVEKRMWRGPPPGTVFIDGNDVHRWPLAELRRNIGYVPQETFLFSDTIRKNIANCGLADVATVRHFDLRRRLSLLGSYPNYFDLVFMDPPYHRRLVESTLDHLHDSGALAQEALIVAEHHVDEAFTPGEGFYKLEDRRRYGKTLVTFLSYML